MTRGGKFVSAFVAWERRKVARRELCFGIYIDLLFTEKSAYLLA
jgi:hypothetical protein